VHTIRGQGELQTHIRGDELDDDAVLIFQVERGTPSGNGDTGARSDIVSREVSKALQIVNLSEALKFAAPTSTIETPFIEKRCEPW